MNRVVATLGAGAISLALTSAVLADQTIQWRQVLNIPKGANLPGGVKVDILGIELGDSIGAVRGKLNTLAKKQASESRTLIRLGSIDAQFPSRLEVAYGDTGRTGSLERVSVAFSTPASGAQAVRITRDIQYNDQASQPLIADVLSQLAHKLNATPIPAPFSHGDHYQFVFDNGRPVTTPDCVASFPPGQLDLPRVNPSGQCDVVYDVRFLTGVSKAHASSITFSLADNERMKQNARADFGYFDAFVKSVQSHAGAAPRL